MTDEERKIAERLQAKVDRERDQEIEIQLGDAGPYRLPNCKVSSAYVSDPRTFELDLETAKGQRIRLPIDASQLKGLKMLIDQLAAGIQS